MILPTDMQEVPNSCASRRVDFFGEACKASLIASILSGVLTEGFRPLRPLIWSFTLPMSLNLSTIRLMVLYCGILAFCWTLQNCICVETFDFIAKIISKMSICWVTEKLLDMFETFMEKALNLVLQAT